MLCFTNKGNNYFTPVIKICVGTRVRGGGGSEEIKWRSFVDGCAQAPCDRL